MWFSLRWNKLYNSKDFFYTIDPNILKTSVHLLLIRNYFALIFDFTIKSAK